MLKELKEYFEKTPIEQIKKDWEDVVKNDKCKGSPTIAEFAKFLNVATVSEQNLDFCDTCQMSGGCRYETIMHNKQNECRHRVAKI